MCSSLIGDLLTSMNQVIIHALELPKDKRMNVRVSTRNYKGPELLTNYEVVISSLIEL